MNIKKWLRNNCNSLKGKRVVITGATGGLGREICYLLAELEADITLACRNESLSNQLSDEIKLKFPAINIDFVPLDFSDIESVDNCIKQLKKYDGIDILINNAGIYNVPIKKLDSGYNNVFQVNFIYTYYLTKKLLPELKKKQCSTCITLSSIAHNYSKIDENDIDFSSRKKPSLIYGNSKRFLTFSMYELFKDTGINYAIVHPGVTLTNMTNHYHKSINWLVKIGIKILFPRPRKAVLSVFYGMTNPCTHYEWIGPRIFNIWGNPKKSNLNTCSQEEYNRICDITNNIMNSIDKR